MLFHADFERLEEISREKGIKVLNQLKRRNIIDRFEFVEDIYSHYDAIGYKDDKICLFEIKLRHINHNTYKDVLFEKDKNDYLKQTPASAYFYISIYEDNKAYVHRVDNVNETNTRLEKIKCPNFPENKPKEYIYKECFLLPVKKQIFNLV